MNLKWHHKMLFVVFSFVVLGLIGGVWKETLGQAKKNPTLYSGTFLHPAGLLPSFRLIDDNGKPFTEESLANQWSVLYFGYSQCPEICPKTLSIMAQTKQFVGLQSPFNMYLISINPEADSPEQLKSFLGTSTYQKGVIQGITGDKEAIQALADSIGVFMEAQAPGQGHIGHSGTLLVINPDGELQALISNPENPQLIAQDLKRLMKHKRRS